MQRWRSPSNWDAKIQNYRATPRCGQQSKHWERDDMKAAYLYQEIKVKAEQVEDAWNSLIKMRNRDRDAEFSSWNAVIDEMESQDQQRIEREVEKDSRRAVKLLYADYCMLRDELSALLKAEYEPKSA